jgi:2'-5' RNA ligase
MSVVEPKTAEVDGQTPLILVHLVEPCQVGQRFRKTRADWPLHITLVPWFFVTDGQQVALRQALRGYVRHAAAFEAPVGAEQLFGPDQNIGVNIMAHQAPLRLLHGDLRKIVKANSNGFRPNASIGSGVEMPYEAHITHHDVDGTIHRRRQGDIEPVRDITLVTYTEQADGPVCEIIEHFGLQGGQA